jgi:hypothetical protein
MAGIFLIVTLSLRFYPLNLPLLEATRHMPENDASTSLYGEKFASEDYSSEYRRLLSTVSPLDRVPHSKTLGVASRIYVIGLPRREDRRASMEKLARAMDITLTWHNATDSSSPIATEILERVRWAREEARKGHEAELQGSDSFPLVFPDHEQLDEFLGADDIDGSELWFLPQSSPFALPPLPPPPIPDTRPPVTYVHDRSTATPYLFTAASAACWHSHFTLLRRIADGDDDVALIFEDDIDMEWDLEKRLRYLWKFLPDHAWDQVMIGHCQSNEVANPPLPGNSYLHRSTHALCAHAYAVTKRSAARIVRLFRNPVYAYSRPIDHGFLYLNQWDLSRQFSVYPSIVTQAKVTVSDLAPGIGAGEDFFLVDSALKRIALWEAGTRDL